MILFRPSFKEIIVAMIIDIVAYLILLPTEKKIFSKIFPDSKIYFPQIQYNKIEKLNGSKLQSFYHSFIKFPARRAIFSYCLNLFKVIPSGLVIILYWERNISLLNHSLLYIIFQIVIIAYFCAISYIEFHEFISNEIKKLHEKFNWDHLFRRIKIEHNRKEFYLQEYIGLIALILSSIFLVTSITILSKREYFNPWEIVFLVVPSLILMARLYFVKRTYFWNGLLSIIDLFKDINYFDNLNKKSSRPSLPLPTSTILSDFSVTFNNLSERLRIKEQEVSRWILYESEQGRFKSIGEISSLIAHDLSGPLNTIHYCVEELNEKSTEKNKYLEHLLINSERSIELIQSLKALLKNPISTNTNSKPSMAHSYVLRILQAELRDEVINPTNFSFDKNLEEIKLNISQRDLVHIIYNLYKNSVENIINKKKEIPLIQMQLESETKKLVKIIIKDNGTGMSLEEFQLMTSMNLLISNSSFKKGLGLRLTRNMIERSGGKLNLLPGKNGDGTTFLLTMKKYDHHASSRNISQHLYH